MASFRGEKYFLSNMYPCTVRINMNGTVYTMKSSESAFQALRCPEKIDEYVPLNGFEAKKLSKSHAARPDWRYVSIDVMKYVLHCKFSQNPDLAAKLIAINGEIVEQNEWYDTFWGVCNGIGQNHLGKCLMELRSQLRVEKEAKMQPPIKSKPKVAICGTAGFGRSTKITMLEPSVKEYITTKLKDYPILIGDCPIGIDKLAQDALRECDAKDVTVYSSSKEARYCASNNFRNAYIRASETGRAFNTCKDIAMVDDADCLLAIWDGKSEGTRRNIYQALEQKKHTMVCFTKDFEIIPYRNKMQVFTTLADFQTTIGVAPTTKSFPMNDTTYDKKF